VHSQILAAKEALVMDESALLTSGISLQQFGKECGRT
jgi:hypothetical protein